MRAETATAVENTAFWIIADETGNVIIDDNRTDFDEETILRLRHYLRPDSLPPKRHYAPKNPHKTDAADGQGAAVIQKRKSLKLRLREKQREIQMEKQEKQMT